MAISERLQKQLTLINLLCMRVSISTEHDAHFSYSGHTNTLNVNVDVGGYKNAEHSEWLLHCVDVVEHNYYELEKCIEQLKGYLK